jgi:hypothetical protein
MIYFKHIEVISTFDLLLFHDSHIFYCCCFIHFIGEYVSGCKFLQSRHWCMGCVKWNSLRKSMVWTFAWLFIYMIRCKWFFICFNITLRDVSSLCMLMMKPIDYVSALMMCQVMWFFACFPMNFIIFITHFCFFIHIKGLYVLWCICIWPRPL